MTGTLDIFGVYQVTEEGFTLLHYRAKTIRLVRSYYLFYAITPIARHRGVTAAHNAYAHLT